MSDGVRWLCRTLCVAAACGLLVSCTYLESHGPSWIYDFDQTKGKRFMRLPVLIAFSAMIWFAVSTLVRLGDKDD